MRNRCLVRFAAHTPLMGAAANGYLDVVKLLLDHGAEADAKDHLGKTAFDRAGGRHAQEIRDLLRAREIKK